MSDAPEPGPAALMLDTVQAQNHLIRFLITALHRTTPEPVETYLSELHAAQRDRRLPEDGPVALQIQLIEQAIADLDHS